MYVCGTKLHIIIVSLQGLEIPFGSAANPSLSFCGDKNTIVSRWHFTLISLIRLGWSRWSTWWGGLLRSRGSRDIHFRYQEKEKGRLRVRSQLATATQTFCIVNTIFEMGCMVTNVTVHTGRQKKKYSMTKTHLCRQVQMDPVTTTYLWHWAIVTSRRLPITKLAVC